MPAGSDYADVAYDRDYADVAPVIGVLKSYGSSKTSRRLMSSHWNSLRPAGLC